MSGQMIETLMNVVFGGVAAIILFAVLGGVFVMQRKAQAAVAGMNQGPAATAGLEAWLEDSGYRLDGLPAEPIEAHVARAPAAFQALSQEGGALHLRRDHQGAHATWSQRYGGTATGYSFSNAWSILLASGPVTPLQIADRDFASTKAAHVKRRWAPRFEGEVVFQDPDMARRFHAYSTDPERARAILESPDVKAALLGLAEVDILVAEDAATLNDPLQTNVLDALGGQAAMIAMARSDPYAAYNRITPFHDRVHDLLAAIADGAGAELFPWQG